MQVPLFKIQNDTSDVAEVAKVIRSGEYWATGKQINEFEAAIANYIGTNYAVIFNSGTSALQCELIAHGVGVGDEVIAPAFTFISTANTVKIVGAKPIFADIEKDTCGLDVQSVEERITQRTKAIILVHYAGCPAKHTKNIARLAQDKGLILVEDNAESFGASLNGSKTGTFGDSAMLSFCQNKIITTGEGGAVVTNDEKIYAKLKLLVSHGRIGNDNYKELGYNFRMPTMNACLGRSQLRRVERLIELRIARAKYYDKRLSEEKRVEVYKTPFGYKNVYQMYPLKISGEAVARDKLVKHLTKNGIGTRICFEPLYKTEYYKSLGHHDSLPTTEEVASKILTLPMFPDLSFEQIDYVVNHIKEGIK